MSALAEGSIRPSCAAKLHEAVTLAAQTLHQQNHPYAALMAQVHFVQDVYDPQTLYMCLPVPDSRACVLFPHTPEGLPPEKTQALDAQYWADKLIGYVNAAVEEGALPSAQQMQEQQEQQPAAEESASRPTYRLSDKERAASA